MQTFAKQIARHFFFKLPAMNVNCFVSLMIDAVWMCTVFRANVFFFPQPNSSRPLSKYSLCDTGYKTDSNSFVPFVSPNIIPFQLFLSFFISSSESLLRANVFPIKSRQCKIAVYYLPWHDDDPRRIRTHPGSIPLELFNKSHRNISRRPHFHPLYAARGSSAITVEKLERVIVLYIQQGPSSSVELSMRGINVLSIQLCCYLSVYVYICIYRCALGPIRDAIATYTLYTLSLHISPGFVRSTGHLFIQ